MLPQMIAGRMEVREREAFCIVQVSKPPFPVRHGTRVPMSDLALIIALAALALGGLGLAVGLTLSLDALFRGRTSIAYEAIIFTAAIVALVCAIIF